MAVTDEGIDTEVSLAKSRKALPPIFVTPLCITTVVIFVREELHGVFPLV
jgi:hypothetical protein